MLTSTFTFCLLILYNIVCYMYVIYFWHMICLSDGRYLLLLLFLLLTVLILLLLLLYCCHYSVLTCLTVGETNQIQCQILTAVINILKPQESRTHIKFANEELPFVPHIFTLSEKRTKTVAGVELSSAHLYVLNIYIYFFLRS